MAATATYNGKLRIGAVTYLNAKPLTECLPELAPRAALCFDLPSRLADELAAGRLDAALLPSIEAFRQPDCRVVSDACIASDGPVRSVKLYSRVPVEQVRSLALDVGSRTSAAAVQILLRERFGLRPAVVPLPIGAPAERAAADAVLLIGDRGMQPPPPEFAVEWDIGAQWAAWSGLPLVFALWVARGGGEWPGLAAALAAARDAGLRRAAEIAEREAPRVGLPAAECRAYLCEALCFRLGPRQRRGLERFHQLAVEHGLAPPGRQPAFVADEGA